MPSEHRPLVAQHDDLGVLRETIDPVGPDKPEHSTEEPVEEGGGHGRAAWLSTSELVKSGIGVVGPCTKALVKSRAQSSLPRRRGALPHYQVSSELDPTLERAPSGAFQQGLHSHSGHLREGLAHRCQRGGAPLR